MAGAASAETGMLPSSLVQILTKNSGTIQETDLASEILGSENRVMFMHIRAVEDEVKVARAR